MQSHGRARYVLEQVAERYAVAMHGVSLSIGSCDPLDFNYLRDLKALMARVKPRFVSDHLCFTGVNHFNSHDLLPLPYTEEALAHVAARVRAVQDFLEVRLLLENPSSYVQYQASVMPEWEFLSRLSAEADCGLLLDINNIYVSCRNHGWDAEQYIDAVPIERIGYHHIAGHTVTPRHLLDTHDHPVCDEVWSLLRRCESRTGGRPVLLEWDANIPSFEQMHAEALKARALSTHA